MGSFVHHDVIAAKLEIARTLGLVTDYLVSPVGPSCRLEASVTVQRSNTTTDGALKHYLARLLDGLVSDHGIAVMPPFAPGETVAETAPQREPVEAADAVPVPVAA